MSDSTKQHPQSTTVWKVLHGAPPTPPPARRDPDGHPNAGQQQKAAAAAAASPHHHQQQHNQHRQHMQALSSSAVSLQLAPSLHSTAPGASWHQQHLQHSSSMDEAFLQHQQLASSGDMQLMQQQQHQQVLLSPSKQAWPTLCSPKAPVPAGSPWGKLPAVATASSPEPDMARSQVCGQHKHNCMHECMYLCAILWLLSRHRPPQHTPIAFITACHCTICLAAAGSAVCRRCSTTFFSTLCHVRVHSKLSLVPVATSTYSLRFLLACHELGLSTALRVVVLGTDNDGGTAMLSFPPAPGTRASSILTYVPGCCGLLPAGRCNAPKAHGSRAVESQPWTP